MNFFGNNNSGYEEIDKEEFLKQQKNRKRRIIFFIFSLILFVVIVLCVVIIIVVLSIMKVKCENMDGKVIKKVIVGDQPLDINKLNVISTGDIIVEENNSLQKIKVELTQYSVSESKQKKKKHRIEIINGTLLIKASESYPPEGLFFGYLCSGTNIKVQVPKNVLEFVDIYSEYGSVNLEYSRINYVNIRSYFDIKIANTYIKSRVVLNSEGGKHNDDDIGGIYFKNSSIGSNCQFVSNNKFGGTVLKNVGTNPRNHSWPSIDVTTKYGDVLLDNVERSRLIVHSMFTGDINVHYYDRNLGFETIRFLMKVDQMSLKECKLDPVSTNHQVVVGKSKEIYDKVRYINGTIGNGLTYINHDIKLIGKYNGIKLIVDRNKK